MNLTDEELEAEVRAAMDRGWSMTWTRDKLRGQGKPVGYVRIKRCWIRLGGISIHGGDSE